MSDKIRIADALDRQAKTYQAIIDAAQMLRELGQIEQVTAEQKAAADAARKEAESAQDDVKKAQGEAKKAKDKAAEIVAKANDQALEVLREAEQKGQSLVDGAAVRAGDIVATAERQAADRTAGVAGQVAQLTSTKVALEQDVATLNHVVETKRIEVDDLEKRLAKAQAQIAKLLG